MSELDDIKFEFDHSDLSMVELHSIGIRTLKDIEYVILEGKWFEIESKNFPLVFLTVSFTPKSQALCVIFSININKQTFKTFNARLALNEEIRKYFCG